MEAKGSCVVCGYEADFEYCCSGIDCGCYGMPIKPPICSEECSNIYFNCGSLEELERFKSTKALYESAGIGGSLLDTLTKLTTSQKQDYDILTNTKK